MTIVDFLYEAKRLGFQGVQLCENFNLLDLNKKELFNIKEIADNLGLFIEIGMNDLTENNLFKHMKIAKILSSNLLRVVISRNTFNNIQNIEYLQESSFDLLKGEFQVLSIKIDRILFYIYNIIYLVRQHD